MPEMTLIDAAAAVLRENPKTRYKENSWLYFVSVLRKLGFNLYITFSKDMPTPESILKIKRDILNNPDNKEKFADIRERFIPEENVKYITPDHA